MTDSLIAAWRTNHRVNLRLIKHISPEGMKCTLSKRGGRNVVREFTHMNFTRVYQLRTRAKHLAKSVTMFDGKDEPAKKVLVAALDKSADAIAEWLRLAAEGDPRVRVHKRGIEATLGYLIAHEAHHRGRILLTLKVCGHPVDAASRGAIWDWNNI